MTDRPFQQSMETRLLIAYLAKAEIGQHISYEEMERVVGHPVDGSTNALYRARHRLLIDSDMVFSTIRLQGIVRLDDRGIVDHSIGRSEHIRRYAKQTVLRASKITDFSALPREYQQKHSSAVSVNATIAFMTSPRQMTRIEETMPTGKKPLPVMETLNMFKK